MIILEYLMVVVKQKKNKKLKYIFYGIILFVSERGFYEIK